MKRLNSILERLSSLFTSAKDGFSMKRFLAFVITVDVLYVYNWCAKANLQTPESTYALITMAGGLAGLETFASIINNKNNSNNTNTNGETE